MSISADRKVRPPDFPTSPLTTTEYQIATLLRQGRSGTEISHHQVRYSQRTVYRILASLRDKLNIWSNRELVLYFQGLSTEEMSYLRAQPITVPAKRKQYRVPRLRLLSSLTTEELQLMKRMAEREFAAMSMEHRAQSLHMHRSTLNERLCTLYPKLSVSSYAEATIVAVRLEDEIRAEQEYREVSTYRRSDEG